MPGDGIAGNGGESSSSPHPSGGGGVLLRSAAAPTTTRARRRWWCSLLFWMRAAASLRWWWCSDHVAGVSVSSRWVAGVGGDTSAPGRRRCPLLDDVGGPSSAVVASDHVAGRWWTITPERWTGPRPL